MMIVSYIPYCIASLLLLTCLSPTNGATLLPYGTENGDTEFEDAEDDIIRNVNLFPPNFVFNGIPRDNITVSKICEPRHDKTNKMSVHPAKTQISLDIRLVWPESSLCVQWVAKDPIFLHADSKDSDQTGGMPRLIWGFAGRTAILLVLSCRGSFVTLNSVSFNIGAVSNSLWKKYVYIRSVIGSS